MLAVLPHLHASVAMKQLGHCFFLVLITGKYDDVCVKDTINCVPPSIQSELLHTLQISVQCVLASYKGAHSDE